mgnify:FL=1
MGFELAIAGFGRCNYKAYVMIPNDKGVRPCSFICLHTFHSDIMQTFFFVDEYLYCCKQCKAADKMKKSATTTDQKFKYTQGLVWVGVNDFVRRDAIRHNDGHMMA